MKISVKNSFPFAIAMLVLVAAGLLIAATTPSFLIGNGKLTTPLNGNGQSMTNVGSISVSNLTMLSGGSVSGLASGVTNGDSSISITSTSGLYYAKATNITEAKQSLSDVTTANVGASMHGYIPKLTTVTNGIAVNNGSAIVYQVLSNLVSAGANITITSTNGIMTIAASGGSGLSTVPMGNSVWVSKDGNDGTGTREDLAKPFLTLNAAKTAATSGDTIFVEPGSYTATGTLLKNGVNWHFFNGAIVTNTSGSGALFTDKGAGAVVSDITGEGQLHDDGSAIVVWLTNSASVVSIKSKTLGGGNPAIDLESGTLTVEVDSITGKSGAGNTIFVESADVVLTVNRSRVFNTWASANSRCLTFTAANTNVVLRDCVFIANDTATNSINGSASSLRIYGSLMSNKTNGPNITLLTGASRFEVSSDVIR